MEKETRFDHAIALLTLCKIHFQIRIQRTVIGWNRAKRLLRQPLPSPANAGFGGFSGFETTKKLENLIYNRTTPRLAGRLRLWYDTRNLK